MLQSVACRQASNEQWRCIKNATAETPCSQSTCFLHLQCCGVTLGYRKTRSVLCKQKTPTVLPVTQYTNVIKVFFTSKTSHGSTVQAYRDVIDARVKNTAFHTPGFGCVRLDATNVCWLCHPSVRMNHLGFYWTHFH